MSSSLGGDPDGDDDLRKQSRLAARAARFNNVLPGNRYKEVSTRAARTIQSGQHEERIN